MSGSKEEVMPDSNKDKTTQSETVSGGAIKTARRTAAKTAQKPEKAQVKEEPAVKKGGKKNVTGSIGNGGNKRTCCSN